MYSDQPELFILSSGYKNEINVNSILLAKLLKKSKNLNIPCRTLLYRKRFLQATKGTVEKYCHEQADIKINERYKELIFEKYVSVLNELLK